VGVTFVSPCDYGPNFGTGGRQCLVTVLPLYGHAVIANTASLDQNPAQKADDQF
jgi:hypothetical protein